MAFKSKKTNLSDELDFKQASAELERGVIHRIYLLSGDEDYLLRGFLNKLKRKVLTPGSELFDYVEFQYGDKRSPDCDAIQAAVTTIPMLSEYKTVRVRNSGLFTAGQSEETIERFSHLIRSVPQGSCLIFQEEQIDRRAKKLFNLLVSEGAGICRFQKQEAADLSAWIASYLGRDGIKLTSEVANSLILRCEASMGTIESELRKIVHYCRYTGTKIVDITLLNLLCREDLTATIFNLSDALGEGRAKDALQHLDRLMTQKEPVQLILFMLAKHVRELIAAKDLKNEAALIELFKIQPFVAKRLLRQVGIFTAERLESMLRACFEADLAIKQGRLEERLALELFLIKAIELGQNARKSGA